MKLTDVKRLLANFHCNVPATTEAIRQFKSESEVLLPDDYLQFLQQTNGGEGLVGSKEYLILWTVEELLRMNKAYEVAEYAPGLFLFGSNGGGEAYAFDKRSNDSIVSVPFVGMDVSLAQLRARSFQEFIEQLFRS